jgi:hypothetical protein
MLNSLTLSLVGSRSEAREPLAACVPDAESAIKLDCKMSQSVMKSNEELPYKLRTKKESLSFQFAQIFSRPFVS